MSRHRRRGRANTRAGRSMMLHIFCFTYPPTRGHARRKMVLIRSRFDHVSVLRDAYAEARRHGQQPYATDIRTVPAPRPTPALDGICLRHTAFPTFLALLTAPGGYQPSLRIDLLGRDGETLARAYDAHQARWGDPRRALVWPRDERLYRHAE
jgi:hypothetical protein